MKLLVLSDLHLEFSGNGDFLPPPSAVDACDLVVLAGDIHNGALGISWAARTMPHRPVLYVAGNHEFYEAEFFATLAALRAAAARTGNVRFLEHDVVFERGVRFIGATLWTDFELFGAQHRAECEAQAQKFITDFRLIRRAPQVGETDGPTNGAAQVASPLLLPADAVEMHRRARAFLAAELAKPHAGPTVVVTHHTPSAASVAERFRTIATSAAFASRLEDLVALHQPQLWIHGHTHDSFDYRLQDTRIICNPMGYPSRSRAAKENPAFAPGFLVDV
jgi:predicted phosphodiesterase